MRVFSWKHLLRSRFVRVFLVAKLLFLFLFLNIFTYDGQDRRETKSAQAADAYARLQGQLVFKDAEPDEKYIIQNIHQKPLLDKPPHTTRKPHSPKNMLQGSHHKNSSSLSSSKSSPWNVKCEVNRNHASNFTISDTKPKFICGNKSIRPGAFLTLMTSMNGRPAKWTSFRNTLLVWPKLKPRANLVLFLTPTYNRTLGDWEERKLAELACELGWHVLVAPVCNEFNYPVLKFMFAVLRDTWTASKWYGFANADILFDHSLMQNLMFLDKHPVALNGAFVMGRRTNIMYSGNFTISTPEMVNNLMPRGEIEFFPSSADYFLSTRDYYPWHEIPPFVIGRKRYDSWLMYYAVKKKLNNVDATPALHALHQRLPNVVSDSEALPRGNMSNMVLLGDWNPKAGHLLAFKLEVRTENKSMLLIRKYEDPARRIVFKENL